MTDMMDALDMTVEDMADEDRCVNCNTNTKGDRGRKHVEGWGMHCSDCYEGMLDVQQEQRQGYYYR